jgi:hypothetical protein
MVGFMVDDNPMMEEKPDDGNQCNHCGCGDLICVDCLRKDGITSDTLQVLGPLIDVAFEKADELINAYLKARDMGGMERRSYLWWENHVDVTGWNEWINNNCEIKVPYAAFDDPSIMVKQGESDKVAALKLEEERLLREKKDKEEAELKKLAELIKKYPAAE